MKALQYTEIGSEPVVVDLPTPAPGPGEILLKVTAAGLCHSDIFVMDMPAEQYAYGLPLTLGHEGIGTIAELGDGVTGFETGGDAVAVYGPWGVRCVPRVRAWPRELLHPRRRAGYHPARSRLARVDGRIHDRRLGAPPRPDRGPRPPSPRLRSPTPA